MFGSRLDSGGGKCIIAAVVTVGDVSYKLKNSAQGAENMGIFGDPREKKITWEFYVGEHGLLRVREISPARRSVGRYVMTEKTEKAKAVKKEKIKKTRVKAVRKEKAKKTKSASIASKAIDYPESFSAAQRPVPLRRELVSFEDSVEHKTKNCPRENACSEFSEKKRWRNGHSCSECPSVRMYKWRYGAGTMMEVRVEAA